MFDPDMLNLIELPDVVFEHIFSFLTYDEIAKNRSVCRKFNETGWYLLNRGFVSAEKYQSASLKAVKTLLPRRESERRKHPLSKKCDILIAIETRLSMLSMAFSRFIETKLCCFIPGKVIDELFRVMRSLDSCKEPQPPHQVLQELRDVSTMAIEYFDDKIAPTLRKKEMMALTSTRGIGVFDMSGEAGTTLKIDSSKFDFNVGSRALIRRHSIEKMVKECCARLKKNEDSSKMNRKMSVDQKKLSKFTRRLQKQERVIKELQEIVNEQAVRLSNNEAIVSDIKRQCDEWKNCRLSQNFSELRDVPAEEPCSTSQQTHTDGNFEGPSKKKRKITQKKGKSG